MEAGHDCCKRDTPGSLDIVVETWNGGTIAIEDPPGWRMSVSVWLCYMKLRHTVGQPKVFEMDVCTRVELSCGLDESVNEFIILLTTHPWCLESKIKFIFKEIFIVSAAVKDDR